MEKMFVGLVVGLLLNFQIFPALAAVTVYTSEPVFLSNLTNYSVFTEGFESDAVWGDVRSTFSSPNSAASVTSQGITWTSNHPATNDITTGFGAAVSGSWGIYDPDHGFATGTTNDCDVNNPQPECLFHDGVSGVRVTGASALYGTGGWFTGTSGANVVIVLTDNQGSQVEVGLGKLSVPGLQPNFFGVIDDTNGFVRFEVREVDGKVGQERNIFADDFTFAVSGAVIICGNKVVEPGEQCDDGNTANGDCCSSSCQFEQAGSICTDGVFCNGAETCNGSGTCMGGMVVDCDDGIACTDDSCNIITDSCEFTPNNANCADDGLFCNGQEFCDLQAGCSSSGDPCQPGMSCFEVSDTCDSAPLCGNGIIESGESCDDGNTVNGDCCSSLCLFEQAGSICTDGVFCNGVESCNGLGICMAGTAVTCDDGVACTDDTCNVNTDSCEFTPNNANCADDGLFCNGQEFCDLQAGCLSSGDPCLSGVNCFEVSDTCDSGSLCGNGIIESGEECDDGNTENGDCCGLSCLFESAGSSCTDNLACNGLETCDGSGSCQPGIALDCNDNNDCTADSCDPVNGCVNRCSAVGTRDPCCSNQVCSSLSVCSFSWQMFLPAIHRIYNTN